MECFRIWFQFFIFLIYFIKIIQCQSYEFQYNCRANDPLSCDQSKNEVCIFTNNSYSCNCPPGVNRSINSGRCILINECSQSRLNDCHENAKCIDQEEGYTCECLPEYADISENPRLKPGRICQAKVNECADPSNYIVDCSVNATCLDTPKSFTCVCNPGFQDISAHISFLPGRMCVEIINECTKNENDCSKNAECIDQPVGYICRCKAGFVDASHNVTQYPGRQCISPEKSTYFVPQQTVTENPHCHPIFQPVCSTDQVCSSDNDGAHSCQCPEFALPSSVGECISFNRCEQHHDCDPSAICSNTYDSYKCQCQPGYLDISPDPIQFQGRKCRQLINECGEQKHDCSPYASCIDTLASFICQCNDGYVDVSSRYGLQPGRRCSQSENYCSDQSLNSCDENADCVTLPDGYTCSCVLGYIDVSSNANLPPGRVCTLQTQCPSQPTDLVFLIDGSGSIGSEVFQLEVLRFVKDFVELFDVAPQKTRVAVVQYSDRIRHEFDLNQYRSLQSLKNGIDSIEYLTGLTRTGAAIEHVVNEAFGEHRGARPISNDISRIAIVITDGRSQDNVSVPVAEAAKKHIQLFAVGVTNHVLDSELMSISGSRERTFHVDGFKDLNTRLRSAIQKIACPGSLSLPSYAGPCDSDTHDGCDRSLNQVCVQIGGYSSCTCPPQFEKHPITGVCGGDLCNPQIVSLCSNPEICQLTLFGNYRCTCANQSIRDPKSGLCKSSETTSYPETAPFVDECTTSNDCKTNEQCIKSLSGRKICQCRIGYQISSAAGICQAPGLCEPYIAGSCDQRKHEECLEDKNGQFRCQCPANHRRHPVTSICLIDECEARTHDCDQNAKCIDTDESYICTCREGFIDESPEQAEKPGRICKQQVDECATGLHNCSVNAYCVDIPYGFLCRCKENYIDFSPNPQHFGGTNCKALVDECCDKSLNTCSENAICIDTMEGYKCRCKQGFIDHDELRKPGRICEKENRFCSNGQNDCDKNARCIEKGPNNYTCVCDAGFLDKSPDQNMPGRNCVERICIDPSRHDCHAAAICTEVSGPERYTCTCRDGYYDVTPIKPGRECKEAVNECLDQSLNDCDPAATCHDLNDGYMCTCPVGSKDISSDSDKPGRKCFVLVNECSNPNLNNCSRFAECINNEEGYECKCKPEYYDNNPTVPGINCSFIINECESPNLNNCDLHAECTDTLEGYKCTCIQPYVDENPDQPGTVCRYNECNDTNANDCDENAICIDTDENFTCQCKSGFYDSSKDVRKPGRECIAIITGEAPHAEKTTLSPNLLPCGVTFCHIDLGEVCIGGEHCGCRPGYGRATLSSKCELVTEIPIEIRIVNDGTSDRGLVYSSDYGNNYSPRYIEIVDKFNDNLANAIKSTPNGPKFVSTSVKYITNPKVKNSTWNNGLLFNGTVAFSSPVDQCDLWNDLESALNHTAYHLGGGQLIVASDIDQLNPCKKEIAPGTPCGSTFCQENLGEICIVGKICGCPVGQKRAKPGEKCRPVESWILPLWVIRDGNRELSYTNNLANPQDSEYQQLVSAFENGVAMSYMETPLKNAFVSVEVNDIVKPSNFIKDWNRGILYNFTVNFVRGSVASPPTVFTDLLDYITQRNNFEIGRSSQYISATQSNPFDICYRSDCHPDAKCLPAEPSSYRCQCPATHRDLNPLNPGHTCVNTIGVNECEHKSWNECDVHARCIDEDHLYRCECIKPYINDAPVGQLPGSKCKIDYCSDVNFCPANTTCKNMNDEAICECLPGYIDIRSSVNRLALGYSKDTYCLLPPDVDECALGLTNCSAVAICINLPFGYKCHCPESYTDGTPSDPGRVCAALLCGLCNGHGDCVHNAATKNITCTCVDGYSGEFCDIAPSHVLLILFLILALILLLLSLCCCIYFCSKTRCFRSRRLSESEASGQDIIGSEYYSIPRAKLKTRDVEEHRGQSAVDTRDHLQRYLDDNASVSSKSSVEVQRRVITDVVTHEIKKTTYHDPSGEPVKSFYEVSTSGADGSNRRIQQFAQSPLEAEADEYSASTGGRFFRSSSASRAASEHTLHSTANERNIGVASEHYGHSGSVVGDESAVAERYVRSSSSVEGSGEMGAHSGISSKTPYMGDCSPYLRSRQLNTKYERSGSIDNIIDKSDGVFDRTTKVSSHRDFMPSAFGRGGTERRRNEFTTVTKSNEIIH